MKRNRPSVAPVARSGDRPQRGARRGVLLLIILSLLAMFGLVAIAFVVLTGQAKRTAQAAARFEQVRLQPENLSHQAAMGVFRGGPGWPHGILEDIYGPDGFDGSMSGASGICGNQIIECQLSGFPGGAPSTYQLVGRVLTLRGGAAKGLSTHIIGYNHTSGKYQIRAFKEISVSLLAGHTCPCRINGAAFGGRGLGFSGPTGQMSTSALRPGDPVHATDGDANEDYDLPDFQNMHLAMAVPIPLAYPIQSNGPIPVPIPSFQRAALIKYWMQQNGAAQWTNLSGSDLREIMPRPSPQLHPLFTGSNPNFKADWNGIYDSRYAWDVDNDGDGIPDSVWIDMGLPLRQAPDGRMLKPLVAVLCMDLDGRLNINAHGAAEHTWAQYNNQPNTSSDVPGGGTAQFADGGNGQSQVDLPRGMGFGPADISLKALFELTDPTLYGRLLFGVAGSHDGRYGSPAGGTPNPGINGTWDRLNFNRHFDYPSHHASFGSLLGLEDFYSATYDPRGTRGYGSPPDIKGIMCVGLDVRGNVLFAMMNGQWANAARDNPYEIDLSYEGAHGAPQGTAPIDNPFSVAEWERIARPFDVDSWLLPSRLHDLTYYGALGTSVLVPNRHDVTPESWDLPVVPFAIDPKDPNGTGHTDRPQHVVDLLLRKFPAATASDVQQGLLLAPELLAGLRMNLNRSWGDGKDNNGNNVVDEIGETNQMDQFTASSTTTVAMNLTNGIATGVPATEGPARQLYARHLYILAMMVADLDYLDAKTGGRAETTRLLAQWAVNVVDFRDRDSIMTRFDFDPDPFSGGWNPDGSHYVWGCERPELLLTETLAFHDRRVEDLETESPDPSEVAAKTDDTNDPDDDFDQRLRPQGSLFFELYNPQTIMEPYPPELYDTTNGTGVDLRRTSPGGAPVWRVAIVAYDDTVASGDPQPDLNDPNTGQRPTIERSVYFVDPTAAGIANHGAAYYPNSATIAPVLPGRYALVGPGEPASTGANKPTTTYMGIGTGETEPWNPAATTRQITLTPNVNPNTFGQVEVSDNGTQDTLSTTNIQAPVAVVIDTPQRLSVTEPTDDQGGHYATNGPGGTAYDEKNGGYVLPFDEPLDKQRDGDTGLWDIVRKDGVHYQFKVLHLQRLANPLVNYNATTNPYITIDTMAVDLTTFNGIENDGAFSEHSGGTVARFITRERGEFNDSDNPNDLWRHEPEDDDPAVPASPGTLTNYHFDKVLGNTLGFLNYHLNNSSRMPRSTPANYKGDPNQPFPWLTWLNRPFVNQYELLLVPADPPWRLLHTYRHVAVGATPDPYNPASDDELPFPHLLNFFEASKTPTSGTPAASRTSPLFCRLLDFVGVPSPFVGTEVQGPPGNFTGGQHFYHPPFNRIPLYREPGRININTLFSPLVGAGLVDDASDLWEMALWDKFVASRRGYGNPTGSTDPVAIQNSMLTINDSYPTRFAGPFRSWSGGHLVPLPAMERDEVDVTMLRPQSSSSTDPNARKRPLLEYRTTQAHINSNQNPYFRYQGMQRLGNLVTTRSNVHAVWITVGYFEAAPITGGYNPALYPDGYQYGQESGIDTGEVKRNRSFYIFDRTIPVGFERGKDLNVEKAILLKRFIE